MTALCIHRPYDDLMKLGNNCPIVVDLDGTLVATDTLFESLLRLVRASPKSLLMVPIWLARGRAFFKRALAEKVSLPVSQLPYREALIDYLREQHAKGRLLILATAADGAIADQVQKHLQIFDAVLASNGEVNLKGKMKLEAIRQRVGNEFTYAGDSVADLAIWRGSRRAILVGASDATTRAVRQACTVEFEVPVPPMTLPMWLRAIRVHQWAKNSLLFVPLLTGFYFTDMTRLLQVLLAFVAFSCVASATYILNDLLDLSSDRQHPRKRLRPLAAGEIPIHLGVIASALLMLVGLALSAAIGQSFLAVTLVYLAITLAYSLALKSFVLLDVLALALLYTIRIVAGAVCLGVWPTSWLLAFSIFMFFSLALVKRCSELVTLGSIGRLASHGRDYRVSDLVILWPVGVGAALCGVVVFGLFINDSQTSSRYGMPLLLWIAALGLLYWLTRLWIKTARGEMHDDPIVFALRDRGSLQTIAAIVVTTLAAHFLSAPTLP